MKSLIFITLAWMSSFQGRATNDTVVNDLRYSGQLSGWMNFQESSANRNLGGIRYIPQLNIEHNYSVTRKLDFEFSINGTASLYDQYVQKEPNIGSRHTLVVNAAPYRAWARYSTARDEVRIGLQKINFGSSMLLRPLRWFDQVDPRDPLQITNGVYGALWRHYFPNNANIWLWSLYGNTDLKGWEVFETSQALPELGGRAQMPTQRGELGLTYHYRSAELCGLGQQQCTDFDQHNLGLDGKWDVGVGLWFEATYTLSGTTRQQSTSIDIDDRSLVNLGTDYTFSIGNGLNMIVEYQAISIHSSVDFIQSTAHLLAGNIGYPLGLNDQLSFISFFVFNGPSVNFLSWRHEIGPVSLLLMGYLSSSSQTLAVQPNSAFQTLGARGVQILAVLNH